MTHLKKSSASRDALASTRDACAPQIMRTGAKLFAEPPAELRAGIFAIELRDKTGADLGRAYCFALVSVGAITKFFCVHREHHFQYASLAFRPPLRQK